MGPEPIVLPLNDPPVPFNFAEFLGKVKGKRASQPLTEMRGSKGLGPRRPTASSGGAQIPQSPRLKEAGGGLELITGRMGSPKDVGNHSATFQHRTWCLSFIS